MIVEPMPESSTPSLVVFLMGPTASGKTDLAVELLQRRPCEIISVDSAMIYRGMDVGTAKPDAETLRRAPHHLIDIRDPAEAYSAADFRRDALGLVESILARGRLPLLVGGTMLYFRALEFGLAQLPQADAATRAALAQELEQVGLVALHRRLQSVDPLSAARIHPNDPQRILRALEVHAVTGEPLSRLQRQGTERFPYPLLKLALAPPGREELWERIALRFRRMLAQGFDEEVRRLWARGDLSVEMPSMRCVGYRQMLGYLRGELDWQRMEELAITATRQLAKRQMTWLRSYPGLRWLDGASPLPQALELLDERMADDGHG